MVIAGYSSGDGYQHVIVATDDGNLTEVYWLTGAVGRGTLTHLASPVVDLAGDEAGGVHHVIAATTDGTLTELTWNGVAPTVRTLAQVEAQPWNHVLGVGAYEAAQEQHVIVAMSNGTLRASTPHQETARPLLSLSTPTSRPYRSSRRSSMHTPTPAGTSTRSSLLPMATFTNFGGPD